MQHLEVSCAVRPIYWPLSVKWLKAVQTSSDAQSASYSKSKAAGDGS